MSAVLIALALASTGTEKCKQVRYLANGRVETSWVDHDGGQGVTASAHSSGQGSSSSSVSVSSSSNGPSSASSSTSTDGQGRSVKVTRDASGCTITIDERTQD